MSNYDRVIPRDLFNESKLLKCMGQLSLKILDRQTPCTIEIDEHGQPFRIGQDPGDGSISIDNYRTFVKGDSVRFCTKMNSRANYPFYCQWSDEESLVFDDKGEFTPEFIEFCKNI